MDGRPGFSALLSVQEPQIILATLTRLRWLAVIGQVIAVAVAMGPLHLALPIAPIATVIGLTAMSNVVLMYLPRLAKPPSWLIQGVLLLDVCLLTALLYLTGGPQNPFAALYLVHMAMAVIVCGAAWTWIIAAAVAVCYGLLLRWHFPLERGTRLPEWETAVGSWVALALVSVLIATFIGRVLRALRQRELELLTAREDAGRNEQLASLTTLAAGAAHELNTPLGTIAVVAKEMELICESLEPGGAMLDDARLIRREVDRCRGILDRMRLDIDEVAGEPAERGAVCLGELVSYLRENLREQDAPCLHVSRDPDLEVVYAPRRALEQSVLVLLRNAFDASPPGEPVSLHIARVGKQVRFEVSDRGCGMSEEVLRRAGQPFFTTKEPGRGMGLGLFVVNLVARQCGGTFSLESRPGVGTRCILDVPSDGAHNSR